MKVRKTAKIEGLVEKANSMILNSVDSCKDGRIAISLYIESILMENGRYNGFCYLNRTDMEKSTNGTTVGINQDADDLSTGLDFENTDPTRVMYYIKAGCAQASDYDR